MDFDSWDKFEKVLYDLSEKEGYKPKKEEFTKGSPLISPAIYTPETTRSNANVTAWGGWAALDVDDYSESFEDAINSFGAYCNICYSSASSTTEHAKFRAVLPLTEHVPVDKIRHFWYALNTEFNSLGDKQTKDLSRMYYVPARYASATNHFIRSNSAPFLDPKTLLAKHPWVDPSLRKNKTMSDRFPLEIYDRIMKHRRESLDNRSFKWTSYSDCPFVSKKMLAEYSLIRDGGWYAKLYAIMVSIAGNAMRKGYPITEYEISALAKEIDLNHGAWYQTRPLQLEAERAISFATQNL